MFQIGETVQVWDWIAMDDPSDPDVLDSHGHIGVIARRSRANDMHKGDQLGMRARDCFQIAIPNRGLVHVNKEWLRKTNEPPRDEMIRTLVNLL